MTRCQADVRVSWKTKIERRIRVSNVRVADGHLLSWFAERRHIKIEEEPWISTLVLVNSIVRFGVTKLH